MSPPIPNNRFQEFQAYTVCEVTGNMALNPENYEASHSGLCQCTISEIN